ncbi:GH36-type glycosyl hydrolase domain-containing protein [Pseudorhodoferax sp. Leaf274]|uniref:GH36-type glycosyl hydrolase domain-containing protein n=1 Tax=Pseudorhodoferax sp. Leaf274 TaxID=1736318 RepID=UPI0007032BB8|nr:glucoamylase family protein [Pseudorhodoferax sp. Leaf274]KQP35855.1 cation tolerance protein CutA [Pseudorhodoferax sp. Leaf274]
MQRPLIDGLPGLSPYARDLLGRPRAPAAAHVRAELFGVQRFAEHGHSLARAQTVYPPGKGPPGAGFFPRVAQNLAALRSAFDYIALTSQNGHYISPAAEWLLDNFHLVEAQLQQIREGVPRRYYAQLPKLSAPPLAGLPRVYGIAWAYVAHTDSVLDQTLFTAFLEAYQDVAELGTGELWALPTTLRVVLLENLRRVAQGIAESKVAREVAHAVWDAPAHLSVPQLDALLAAMDGIGQQAAYLTQLWQRLPVERGDDPPPVRDWTERHCADGPALLARVQGVQASTNLTVGNIVTTLRLVGQVEWSDLIDPISRPLRVLRQLPSFGEESERTRQQITSALEQVARSSRQTERAVAQAVLQRALAAGAAEQGGSAAAATAGYHLFGNGRAALLAQLGPPQAGGARPGRRFRLGPDATLALCLLIAAAGTAVLLAAGLHRLQRQDMAVAVSPWLLAAAAGLFAMPLFEAVMALLHRLVAESTQVEPLPRLSFADGIPAAHRVLVVVPALLTSAAAAVELAQALERHWLANREAHAQFALLTDWPDADIATLPDDRPVLQAALAEIAALNQRHPPAPGEPPRFALLHRPRRWCFTQQRWIGWERKRGKLEMLLRLLATGKGRGFVALAPGQRLAERIAYVVTLDSDTILPPGTLRELVAVAAHPLNAPVVDARTRRVTAGFGILQPRILAPLPARAERSPFHWLFAGQCGIDPYSAGASDIYQDLFGSGSFTGKGLLHVRALHAALDRRLPDDAVLSHDLLEGTLARCALVSDLAFVEAHPHHAGVAAARLHRWMRGDWQLLPLMRHARHFGIDALGLWKMADNLRRALLAPACAALLVLALFTAAVPLGWALAVVAAAFALGPLLGACAALVPTRRGIAWRHFLAAGATELARAAGGAAWQCVQLAAQSRLSLDAALRSLWRLAVSRRRLLEWTTAAQAQAQAGARLIPFLRVDALPTLLCLALAGAATQGPHPGLGPLILGLWACAPLLSWWGSRVPTQPDQPLTLAERDYAGTLARDTWRFFEQVVGPDDHHLPPDNLQIDPQPALAHRTSPTNIGMYLLAACCAERFGWIDRGALVLRLAATLDTVERLDKHRGHLYNWYETRTLQVLAPAYVSSVDSGNLAGHLVAVAQACRLLAGDGHASAAALLAQAQRCEALCAAMDFRGLYDGKRHLFHIGLRADDNALDAGYYDLLASEARLLSFLAIAKGDVPRRHWSALGRVFLPVGMRAGLKSWSGSMFEYLMPLLVMDEPRGSLLRGASRAAVQAQRAFARVRVLPWGVSESAYAARDHSLAYQYAPFGVPRLALRRTPLAEQVVAPYASAMASMVAPQAALANLQRLQALGGRGELGFFDALDFTAARQLAGQPVTVVRNFMAHHQGMALVALCNLLCEAAPRRWFAAAPLVRAHATLLHERTPRQIVGSADPRTPPEPQGQEAAAAFRSRAIDPLVRGFLPTQLLSNGRYTVALRPNGAGVSRWRAFNVSRWRDDPLRDDHGSFLYVREAGRLAPTSLTALPAPGAGWAYRCLFLADRVQFDAQGDGLRLRTVVRISPEDDTELRTVTLHNEAPATRVLELISCFEPVLSNPKADEAHPAFANLFVRTHWRPEWRALLLERRPRLPGEPVVAAAHFLGAAECTVLSVDGMTDRRAFIGRNRTLATPALHAQPVGADGQPSTGLDPIAGLRVRLSIGPGETASLTFGTTAGESLEGLYPSIDRYMQPTQVERAARLSATLAQVRMRDLGADPQRDFALQDLATILTYTTPRATQERGLVDLRALWRFGISGDKPIVLVRIHGPLGMGLLHALLRAQPWWGFGGVACDVVVLNGEPDSYAMPLQRGIEALRSAVAQQVRHSFAREDVADFHLLREREIAPHEQAALAALARAVFTADGRPLEVQVAALRDAAERAAPLPESVAAGMALPWAAATPAVPATAASAAATTAATTLPACAPSGRFDAATGEYCVDIGADRPTPRPWVNVIANSGFGFQVSESGVGYTWAVNSRLHQLTPWSNDPVRDPAFEHYLLQDLDTGAVLPLLPANAGGQVVHRVRHGQGYSVFECAHQQLALQATFFADRDDAVKLVQVRVHHTGSGRRRLRVLALAEWQLGAARGQRRTLHTWKPQELPAVFAQQRESSAGFGGSTAFLMLTGLDGLQWSCDRGAFFGPGGTLELPARLAQRQGSGLDACGAVAADAVLDAGAQAVVCFVLGHADTADAATALARRWQHQDAGAALLRVRGFWDELLGRVQVRTPDPLFDVMVNRWLLYQTLSCRIWSKAGFYQAGGASGFRDQLQDAMAFALWDPARLHAQILACAARQFPEGDVQHWWHLPGGAGVRTHFSDDLLWLPLACTRYVETTGEAGLLDQRVAFIDGPPVPPGAEDLYATPTASVATASIYEHAARAIDKSLNTGRHGLPLMGSGDWNDGMNRVGHAGHGESVWLGWFLCSVVDGFAPYAEARGEHARARRWRAARAGWTAALHGAGWDGDWFRRAFFDDGSPLGASTNAECRIDLIAQAWSVLSCASQPRYTQAAMAAVQARLVDSDAGLLRLLDPPFAQSEPSPGYIQAYPPGVRENGGQYAHAAVWALMAQATQGDSAAAWRSWRGLSPAHRAAHAEQGPRYELEPYVMAGDIYSAPPYVGRGGWSWYTGSAAWMHRAAVETLLGLRVHGGRLCLVPCVPDDWPGFELVLRLGAHRITVQYGSVPAIAAAAVHRLAVGEWIDWRRLPTDAVLCIASAAPVPAPAPASACTRP